MTKKACDRYRNTNENKTSVFNLILYCHFYMDFNAIKMSRSCEKYLSNDVYDRFVAHTVNTLAKEVLFS